MTASRPLRALRRRLAHSALFAFNPVLRDRWVAQQAHRLPQGAVVLDVGAGSAPYRELFAHCDYRTQDFHQLSDRQLRYGGYDRIDYVSDAAAIPVADATFDAVLCTEMLEHVPDPLSVLRELARILRAGGRLMLTAPLGSGIHQEPYHFYGGFTPYWYRRFLPEAGFADIQILANGGSPRFFSQEALRFLRLSAPWSLRRMSLWQRMLWTPLWLALAPVLGLAVPVLATWLDRYDQEQRFTVGYHVTARRRGGEP